MPGKSHGQRGLAGYSPWSHKASDTEQLAAKFEEALAASNNANIYGDNALKLGLTYEAMGDEAKAQKVYKNAVETHTVLAAKFSKYIKE